MKKYKLSYLPLFEQDLLEIVNYISHELYNPEAAESFLDNVENAIMLRLKNPLAFEAYNSSKAREHVYYRIYVQNYTIFYVVIGDIVEIRRILYSPRNHANLV